MGDPEVLARQAFKEVACDRLSRCEADAVNESVKLGPNGTQILEKFFNLRVVAHIAVVYQCRIEVRSEFRDAILETLPNVAEGQFRTLLVASLGDAVRDGSVGQNARDQQFLAG